MLTTETLIEHVWGAEGGARDMLRQLVHRLRSKIVQVMPPESAPVDANSSDLTAQLPRIETIPGLGYGLNVDTE